MAIATKISFPVVSFRKIVSPYDSTNRSTYMAVVNVRDVPNEIGDWRSINVRDPKLTGGVAKKIRESLTDAPDSFFFKNRGMTLMVEQTEFDNQSNILAVELSNKELHGLLDGGHTFKVIREYADSFAEEDSGKITACVKIEILAGISELEDVVGIVEARNTSTQVREQSLEELRGNYNQIKEVLQHETYAESIAYKEYELAEDGSKKDIDIKDILSYLVCFDTDSFDGNKHPIIAYSGKGVVVQHVKDHQALISKYIPLLPKILALHDHIYATLPDAYNNSTGGKFGKLVGVGERKPEKLPFSQEVSKHQIPSAFIYPLLAAFRALLKSDQGKCSWVIDPIKFYDSIKVELAERIVDQAMTVRNPNKMGKDKATWGRCYDLVRLSVLERNLL